MLIKKIKDFFAYHHGGVVTPNPQDKIDLQIHGHLNQCGQREHALPDDLYNELKNIIISQHGALLSLANKHHSTDEYILETCARAVNVYQKLENWEASQK